MLAAILAIEVAGWSAGAVRVPSSPAAWGGIRGERGPERVADYHLRASLDPARHTLEGSERLSWRNRSREVVSSVYLHLYLNAFESQGSTFNRERQLLGGFRTDAETRKGEYGYVEMRRVVQGGTPVSWAFVHPDGGPETDHTVVRLDLPHPVAAGGTLVLDIDFFDQLPRVVARAGWFDRFHLVAQWYPKIGVLELPGERGASQPRWNCHEFHLNSEFYADFGSYRAEITVPRGYTFGSTGVETAAPEETEKGVRHLVAQDAVHDFAFTAWDGFAPPLLGRWEDVQVKVLHPPEYAEAGRIALQSTLDSLAYFSSTLGRYPHRQVTVVVPPYNALEAGGMEYETFFTTIGGLGPPWLQAVRFVTVHEFGHGYFMGLLASNEFEEPFLDEGLNELWDARMLQSTPLRIPAPGLLGKLGLRTPAIGYFDLERAGTQRFQADPIAGNSWERYSRGSYGLVYARTAMVFHDLESLLGGEVLARGFREYYRRWKDRHPSTADLEAALADVAGAQAERVHRWFAEQVYDRAPIDDRVEMVETQEDLPPPGLQLLPDGARKELAQEEIEKEIHKKRPASPVPWRSVVAVRRYAAHVPQTLLVRFDDGSEETFLWPEGERWHRYLFDRKVASAQLDPERKFLLDLDKLDDGRTREPSRLASRRWTLEFKAWAELALALLASL